MKAEKNNSVENKSIQLTGIIINAPDITITEKDKESTIISKGFNLSSLGRNAFVIPDDGEMYFC